MIARLKGLPLVWQTLMLLIASVAVAQAIGILVLLIAPPPRPDFNRTGDIAAALRGQEVVRHERGERERELTITRQSAAPLQPKGMVADPALTQTLADRLRADPDDVRLWFEPDRPAGSLFSSRRGRGPVSFHDGEQIFFTRIVAAVHLGDGWTVARTPPPPWIPPWQRRMAVWFALSAVALSPLAWLFARALTRPIRRLADAANRLGTDPLAPPLAEEAGPAELRVTAHALNRMQARLTGYVGERTAMIGAIAHDLRTPLARIAFRIEAAPEPIRDKVMADVEQMRAMLAATIGFVRNIDSGGARVPVDLTALVNALIEQEASLGRSVAAGELEPATVVGDPIALERLLQNLIDNGIAYGGEVRATVQRNAGEVRVTIADRGPGMDEALLVNAFQPFVRGDPSRNRNTGGIGLGLTIARTIAEDHGGTLTLANQSGGGLEAVLRLPVAA